MAFVWTHAEFRFQSRRDWVPSPTDTESQMQFFCPSSDTTISLTVDPYQSDPEKIEMLAGGMLAIRKNAHIKSIQKLAQQGEKVNVTYDFERVSRHETGTAYEMSFAGCHAGKSMFGYLGYLTSRKIVHVFVDTKYSFAPGRGRMYQEVVNGFEIVLP